MDNEFNISPSPENNPLALRSKQMDLEAGWLGKAFGSGANAPMNIAGVLVIVLLFSGIAALFIKTAITAADYWKIIAPLLTLVMGYMVGKGSNA